MAYIWATSKILTEIKIVFTLSTRLSATISWNNKAISWIYEYGCLMICKLQPSINIWWMQMDSSCASWWMALMNILLPYRKILFCRYHKRWNLSEAIVVITSRIAATVSLDQVDRRIDILGLPKWERDNYISAIFSDSLAKKVELDK